MIETIKYGFYTVNPDYLEYLNQIDSEVYYNSSYRNSIKPFVGRLTYNKYRLYHAVTATQKTILKAFEMDASIIKHYAEEISLKLEEAKKEDEMNKKK